MRRGVDRKFLLASKVFNWEVWWSKTSSQPRKLEVVGWAVAERERIIMRSPSRGDAGSTGHQTNDSSFDSRSMYRYARPHLANASFNK